MNSCRIGVKAVPGASQDQLAGWLGDDIKIRIQAPPENGRANSALCRYLASLLAIPKTSVSVIAGHSSQRKTVEIAGLSKEEFRERLNESLKNS